MSDERTDVLYGTLALLILKTLDTMGTLHGYALARRIEQVSEDQLILNQGTSDVSSVNLRGFGLGRTLVLLNDRRLAVADGIQANANAIPIGAS